MTLSTLFLAASARCDNLLIQVVVQSCNACPKKGRRISTGGRILVFPVDYIRLSIYISIYGTQVPQLHDYSVPFRLFIHTNGRTKYSLCYIPFICLCPVLSGKMENKSLCTGTHTRDRQPQQFKTLEKFDIELYQRLAALMQGGVKRTCSLVQIRLAR